MSNKVTKEFMDKNKGREGQPAMMEKEGQWVPSRQTVIISALTFAKIGETLCYAPFDYALVDVFNICPFTLEISKPVTIPVTALSASLIETFKAMKEDLTNAT